MSERTCDKCGGSLGYIWFTVRATGAEWCYHCVEAVLNDAAQRIADKEAPDEAD